MRDNYLFQRICRECDKWEQEVKGGWWTYPKPKKYLAGVYIDVIGDDGDCYDGVYVTSVRQAKVFLKSCEEFLNG